LQWNELLNIRLQHFATKQEIENLAKKFGVKLERFYPKK
jgi:hypothetical protein